MKRKLELLEQLQEIDLQIDALNSARDTMNSELEAMDNELQEARAELSVLEERAGNLENEKGELESSNAVELENIKRSELHMKEIKTNKEYQAVGREIAAARKLVADFEEQILNKISQIEELNSQISERKSSLADLEVNIEQRRNDKLAEIENLKSDIDSDTAKRDKIAKELPSSVVKRYTLLRGQRRGQAIAIARDGSCLGCNMNLPPQLYNNLYKGDELLTCPHCQRVLILKQPTQ